ncbi:hypothetical protein [Marispirochaeta sp.]|uniref:hypothetical protein n=1 Tax=Marispirochaeta sp. TaxID=2038653 RepID=UPI0029C6290C|nr:hypothetical protein [Marispirochaeta sp.]
MKFVNTFTILIISSLFIAIIFPLYAENGDFDDGSFFQEIEENQEEPASVPSRLDISGRMELNTRYAFNSEGLGEGEEVRSIPELRLDLDYRGKKADLRASGRIEQVPGEKEASGQVDEAYIRYYARGFDLEIGYMKPIWGPGDKVHAVDVLTPIDYSDFINPDYTERKQAETMIKLNIPVNEGLLELVYLPVFTPDTVPWEGVWTPMDVVTYNVPALAEEQTADFSHSSFAFRYTESLGAFDLGGIYYMGYYRQPTVSFTNETLSYDRINMIGIHGTAVTGGLTLRAEAGWYASDDFQGDDPEVRNSEFRWVGGFDYNIPVSRFNINIQETGTLLLNSDGIEKTGDVQADTPTTANMLIFSLRDSWSNDTIEPEITLIMSLENQDYLIKPSLTALFQDELEFSLACSLFGGSSDGNFGHFNSKDFIELSISYIF